MDADFEPGKILSRQGYPLVIKALVALVLMQLIALAILFNMVGDIQNEQRAVIEADANIKLVTLRNRAVACDIEQALGLKRLSDECYIPNIVALRTEEIPKTGAAELSADIKTVVCLMAARQGMVSSVCEPE